jgi:hypothetical protein
MNSEDRKQLLHGVHSMLSGISTVLYALTMPEEIAGVSKVMKQVYVEIKRIDAERVPAVPVLSESYRTDQMPRDGLEEEPQAFGDGVENG